MLCKKVAWPRSCYLLLNFGTPCVNRLKIQTSNFAGGLRVRGSKQKYKTGLKGVWPRSGDLLLDAAGISGKAEATKFKFCRWIEVKGY